MSNLLLVTSDSKIAEKISALAAAHNFNVRTANSEDEAIDWLTRQHFAALLVDAGDNPVSALELLESAWKYHPLLSGAIFSTHSKINEIWQAALMGARVFSGENTLTKIEGYLKTLSQQLDDSSQQHNTVLYVEDLDSPRDIVSAYVQALGYPSVVTAANANEALLKLRAEPEHFFCALVDIHMPGISGIKLTEEIRKDARLAFLPIVILTADPSPDNLIDCVRAGVSGFLAKPPKKRGLLKELEKARRITIYKQSPRLCAPEEAHLLEDALIKHRFR